MGSPRPPRPLINHSAPSAQRVLPLILPVFYFCTQNLTNEEQVVVIQARTVLTLAEKVTGTVLPDTGTIQLCLYLLPQTLLQH